MDRVVHFEIPFDNKERAEKFYKQIFGWEMSNVSEMDYTFVNTVPVDGNQTPTEPGAINGGLTARNTPGETPVVVVSVSSIDDYIKRIEDNGGEASSSQDHSGKYGPICASLGYRRQRYRHMGRLTQVLTKPRHFLPIGLYPWVFAPYS